MNYYKKNREAILKKPRINIIMVVEKKKQKGITDKIKKN